MVNLLQQMTGQLDGQQLQQMQQFPMQMSMPQQMQQFPQQMPLGLLQSMTAIGQRQIGGLDRFGQGRF